MANVKISAMPNATTVAGTEQLAGVQGGANVNITPNQIKTYVAAATPALVLISEVVTAASQASVSFSSIPATYRDLVIRVRGRGDTSATSVSVELQFNGDTAAHYSREETAGVGSTTASDEAVGQVAFFAGAISAATAPASLAGSNDITVYDYRGTTFFKAIQSMSAFNRGVATMTVLTQISCGSWQATTAINAVLVFLSAGNFVNGSVVSLYGSL